MPTDLQSAPIGHSGIYPKVKLAKSKGGMPKAHQHSVLIVNKIDSLTWCLEAESNHRHEDFQSSALPTELSRQVRQRVSKLVLCANTKMATLKGFEPTTSAVTGRRSNQLSYRAKQNWWTFTDLNRGPTGYEPVALTN